MVLRERSAQLPFLHLVDLPAARASDLHRASVDWAETLLIGQQTAAQKRSHLTWLRILRAAPQALSRAGAHSVGMAEGVFASLLLAMVAAMWCSRT